jgi:NitT/TauT family transport system substrate-binding protein
MGPGGKVNFVDFMRLAGTIKVAPAKWSELFIPGLSGRDGN